MSQKKRKLSISIEEDYCLLGVVSDEPDYKLCWLINERLKFSFTKADDLVLFNKKLDIEQYYPIFQYDDETTMLNYRIIGNRVESGSFLSEMINIDYILHSRNQNPLKNEKWAPQWQKVKPLPQ